jgi:CheY-like chemotaxis protein
MPHKLLLADDSVTIQRVIELTFADEDVQVTAVGNGQEAIERVQRDRPDIILADVGMPERNGYEVAAFVKGNPSTAHIPVVLLTGAFEPVDEGRARAVGCDGVLVKPFEPQIVISRVKDLLAGRAPSGMWSTPSAQGPVRQGGADTDLRAAAPATSAPSDPLEAYFDRLDAAFASAGSSGSADPFAGLAAPAAGTATARETIPLARRQGSGEAPASTRDPFGGWDPDLTGDPAKPAEPPRPAQPPAPPAAARTPVAAAPAPAAPTPTPTPTPPPQAAAAPPRAAAPPQTSAPPPAASAPPPSAPAPAPLPASLVDAFAALLAAEQKMGLTPSAATAASPPPASAPEPAPVTDEMIEEISARVLARLSADARPSILDVAERLVREEIERIKRNA